MKTWPKNGSWSWPCFQLGNSVCRQTFQINSHLPTVIKGQKGASAQQRHLVGIFFSFLNSDFVQEYWSCGDVVCWEEISGLGWISERMTSGMTWLDYLTVTWLRLEPGAPDWGLWRCTYLIPPLRLAIKIPGNKMLSVHWTSEKLRKISGSDIKSMAAYRR